MFWARVSPFITIFGWLCFTGLLVYIIRETITNIGMLLHCQRAWRANISGPKPSRDPLATPTGGVQALARDQRIASFLLYALHWTGESGMEFVSPDKEYRVTLFGNKGWDLCREFPGATCSVDMGETVEELNDALRRLGVYEETAINRRAL